MRWVKRIIIAIVVLAAGALLVFALLPKPLEVDTATVERGPMRVTIEANGRTRAREVYTVAAPTTGVLSRIELEPGDEVTKGTPFAYVTPPQPPLQDARTEAELKARRNAAVAAERRARAAVEQARVELDYSIKEHERLKPLVSHGSLPLRELEQAEQLTVVRQKELETAQLSAQVAAGEVRVLSAQLLGTASEGGDRGVEIRAPTDGRVLRVLERGGVNVDAGKPLLEIASLSNLEIVVEVLTVDALKIPPHATILLQGLGGGAPLKGRVRLIEPKAFTKVSTLGVEEQRVNVIADIDGSVGADRLGDGYRVDVQIVIWEQADVVKIPTSAIFRQGADWAAFVVTNDVAERRRVELGQRNALEAEVKSGLDPGQRVIVYPSDTLADKMNVAPR